MTDRGAAALAVSDDMLRIGPSAIFWDGANLVVEIDEATWPVPGRLRGRVTLTPAALTSVELPLTADGAHVWRPFAPLARIRVALDRPGWTWEGHGYLDANFGIRALEADFSRWTWGRYPTGTGATCFYDAVRRDGSAIEVAVRFDAAGRAGTVAAPPKARLPRSRWGLVRETRADPGFRPRQALSMLDAPFYCRAAVRTCLGGQETTGVHEALDLDRFRSPLLMPMLALRVPRRKGWP